MNHVYPAFDWWASLGWLALPLFWAVVLASVQGLAMVLRRRGSQVAAPSEPCPVAVEVEVRGGDPPDRSAAA